MADDVDQVESERVYSQNFASFVFTGIQKVGYTLNLCSKDLVPLHMCFWELFVLV